MKKDMMAAMRDRSLERSFWSAMQNHAAIPDEWVATDRLRTIVELVPLTFFMHMRELAGDYDSPLTLILAQLIDQYVEIPKKSQPKGSGQTINQQLMGSAYIIRTPDGKFVPYIGSTFNDISTGILYTTRFLEQHEADIMQKCGYWMHERGLLFKCRVPYPMFLPKPDFIMQNPELGLTIDPSIRGAQIIRPPDLESEPLINIPEVPALGLDQLRL